MSRVPINMFLSLSGRRAYAVAATRDTVSASAEAAVRRTTTSTDSGGDGGGATAETKTDICWMPDPRSGNWVPENQFGEVDAAELRAQLLPKKQ